MTKHHTDQRVCVTDLTEIRTVDGLAYIADAAFLEHKPGAAERAHAARIAACWNACIGMSTKALESGAIRELKAKLSGLCNIATHPKASRADIILIAKEARHALDVSKAEGKA